MHFSTNIRLLRKRKNRTQEIVASELGYSRSTLNSYENGSVVNPTLDALVKFSNYFKISIDTLIKMEMLKLSELQLRELELGHDAYVRGTKLPPLEVVVLSM